MATNYIHGNLTIRKPKHLATTKKVLNYRFSYGVLTDSLRFYNNIGTPIKDNSLLVEKYLKPRFDKIFATLINK